MYKMFDFNILQKSKKKRENKEGKRQRIKGKQMCLSCKQKMHVHILAKKKKSTALVQLYNILYFLYLIYYILFSHFFTLP